MGLRKKIYINVLFCFHFSPNIAKIAGWSVLVVALFLGILISSYFRYVKIFRAISFVDPLLSHNAGFNTSDPAEEMKKEE